MGWIGERLEARVILGGADIIITFIVIIFVIMSAWFAWFAEGCTRCIHLVPAVTTLRCTPGAQVFFFCILFAVLCGQVGCRDKVSSPLHGLPNPMPSARVSKIVFKTESLLVCLHLLLWCRGGSLSALHSEHCSKVVLYQFSPEWHPCAQERP